MHPVVLKSSQLILAGDIVGAENALVAIADQHGDHALVSILDELQPKDLLAIMREFDSSKESVVNMLVTPEQFSRSIILEKKYGERTSERLRAMMNAVRGGAAARLLVASRRLLRAWFPTSLALFFRSTCS